MSAKSSITEIVDEIVTVNMKIADFWQNGGWAHGEANSLLSQSRLDRQVSLSRTLKLWVRKVPGGEEDARLILGWANLGTLIEGSMKFFLCVFHDDYAKNPLIDFRRNKRIEPDGMMLEVLRQFFVKNVWDIDPRKHWGDYVALVQQRRNAIHAFQDKNIGNLMEFRKAVRMYLRLVKWVDGTVPYPDGYGG